MANKKEFRKIGIGVGVLVLNDKGKILATHRLPGSNYGSGALALVGGHIEEGETILQTVVRETKEETGLDVEPIELDNNQYVYAVNEWFIEGRHQITLYVATYVKPDSGELTNTEPNKHDEWRWYTFQELAEAARQAPLSWVNIDAIQYLKENELVIA